jgi:superfamily II DNA/RNA helicase
MCTCRRSDDAHIHVLSSVISVRTGQNIRWSAVTAEMVSQTAPEQTIIERFKALGVCEELAEAAAALGWKSPTHIQEQAVPHLLQGGQ